MFPRIATRRITSSCYKIIAIHPRQCSSKHRPLHLSDDANHDGNGFESIPYERTTPNHCVKTDHVSRAEIGGKIDEMKVKAKAREAGVVWSCNEWDPLEEVIVGTAEGAMVPQFTQEIKATCPEKSWSFYREHGGRPYPQHFIDKATSEVEELCRILRAEGVTVRRPEVPDFSRRYTTPHFTTTGFHAANPRDCLMVVEDEIIESPMTWRCRYYDYLAYRPLVKEYFNKGARWSQAPKSTLTDDLFNQDHEVTSLIDRYEKANMNDFLINEHEPTFDAADFIRAGRLIFAQRSQVTNLSGIEWLRRHLAPRGIHVQQLSFRDSSAMHIDATFNVIGPRLAITNPARPCRERGWLEERGWELLTAGKPTIPEDHPMHVATKWLAMNILMLNPRTALIEAHESGMINMMEKRGFHVIKVPFRHAYTFGGGLHCWTVDIRRRGGMTS